MKLLFLVSIMTMAATCFKSVEATPEIPLSVWKSLSNVTSTEDFINRFLRESAAKEKDEVNGLKAETKLPVSRPNLNFKAQQQQQKRLAASGSVWPGVNLEAVESVSSLATSLASSGLGCRPLPTCVTLTLPNRGTDEMNWPTTTEVQRCGGCCQHDRLHCVVTESEKVNVRVIKARYVSDGFISDGHVDLEVEQHKRCACTLRS